MSEVIIPQIKSAPADTAERRAFVYRQNDLTVKCSQTSGAPQAVLFARQNPLSADFMSEVIIPQIKSASADTAERRAFVYRQNDLTVKCSQTSGAPQAVLFARQNPLSADFMSEVIIPLIQVFFKI